MPREEQDLYPEEVKENITPAILEKLFDDYVTEAIRLQAKFSPHLKILVGMEVDWIRPSSEHFIEKLLIKYPFDLFIGSIHHVHTRPIDYDHQMYAQARGIAGGTDERIFEDYFDTQYDMLKALHPPIVGHFDVIRLKADEPDGSLMRWDGVWHRILRNLDFIAGYGGVLELNSAALRKGMSEPYPKAEVCQAFKARGGGFTLSDDCHGIGQVGTNYDELLRFVEEVGIEEIVYFELGSTTRDSRFPNIDVATFRAVELVKTWFSSR
ncbi:MAG: hypothetical protein Q9195_003696 [Heterodermia aff. obscurata]